MSRINGILQTSEIIGRELDCFIEMYPIFEYGDDGISLYYKDRDISPFRQIISNKGGNFVVSCDSIYENSTCLVIDYNNGDVYPEALLFIPTRREDIIISDATCMSLFDLNISIGNRHNEFGKLIYDKEIIKRRFTINNIIAL